MTSNVRLKAAITFDVAPVNEQDADIPTTNAEKETGPLDTDTIQLIRVE